MPRLTQNPAPEAGVTAPAAAPAVPPVQAPPPARQRRKARKASRARRNSAPASRPATIRSRQIEPMEQTIGQDHPRLMKSTGPARDSLEPALIQVVDRPVDKEKLEMLAFMDEPVTVFIHETSDPAAEQVFEIFNNGVGELFSRGQTKTVKRKYVNELATRKLTTYTQKIVTDNEGARAYQQVPHTALRYPFSIVRDDHPRGPDWLKFTLAQA